MMKRLKEDLDILAKKAKMDLDRVYNDLDIELTNYRKQTKCTFCTGDGHTAASCSSKKKLDSMFAHDPYLKLTWRYLKLTEVAKALQQ